MQNYSKNLYIFVLRKYLKSFVTNFNQKLPQVEMETVYRKNNWFLISSTPIVLYTEGMRMSGFFSENC